SASTTKRRTPATRTTRLRATEPRPWRPRRARSRHRNHRRRPRRPSRRGVGGTRVSPTTKTTSPAPAGWSEPPKSPSASVGGLFFALDRGALDVRLEQGPVLVGAGQVGQEERRAQRAGELLRLAVGLAVHEQLRPVPSLGDTQ